jgi:hypothetical protein
MEGSADERASVVQKLASTTTSLETAKQDLDAVQEKWRTSRSSFSSEDKKERLVLMELVTALLQEKGRLDDKLKGLSSPPTTPPGKV